MQPQVGINMSRNNAAYAAYLLHKGRDILSSEQVKDIKGLVDPKELASAIFSRAQDTGFNQWDLDVLDEATGWQNEGELSDEVLQKYADHIFNYEYTYKPEAQSVDPSIDTQEEHIGPMAQDIEQVNPACVKEVNGYKTVDTGRLALMNAGAIAALAREIMEIKHGG